MLFRFYILVIVFFFSLIQPLKCESVDSLLIRIDTTVLSEGQVRLKLQIVDKARDSDIRQAILFAKSAFKDAQELKDKKLIAESQLAIGNCYSYIGASAEALENLSKALTMFGEIGDRFNKAQTLMALGNIYFYSNEFNLALEYYDEVFDYGEILEDSKLMLMGIMGKGSVYSHINKLDSALIIFNETFQLAKDINDKPNEIHSLYNMGEVYRSTGRVERALEIFNLIEQSYDKEEIHPFLLTNLYFSFIESYLQLRDTLNVQKYSQKAREIVQRISNSNHKMEYYRLSFKIDTMCGAHNSAINNHMQFKELSDSINSIKFKESLAKFQILYGLNVKEEEIERLRLDNELKDLTLKQRRIVNYGSGIVVFLMLVVVFQTYRSKTKSKEKNLILQHQREELVAANEELIAINEELHTQRKELQLALKSLKETQNQLIRSEKMASLGMLSAGVAHEINNPLNFIRGGVLAIENYVKDNFRDHLVEVSPLLEILNIGVERVAEIVAGLDDYTRRDDVQVTAVNINLVMDSCLLILQNQFNNRISIEKDYTNYPLIIESRDGKIHQAFLSILTNAVQSIEGNGTISIATNQKNKSMIVVVADTGCGISEEDIIRVTDPFFTTKDPGKGTGLGLSITQNIIEEHNGSISFNSEIGVGTTVTVLLPIKRVKT
ncbi:MAG: tetratricopeptide repeat protein [Bacteroidales bacterium]|nr:tetratricopeptide repeat protein [Bacteroidales bacterium]